MSVWSWLAVGLSVLRSGWMTFDGLRALTAGDYVTVNGQLGPWAKLVEALGLAPRSTPVKVTFVVLGLAGLAAVLGFATRQSWSALALGLLAVGTLWYLPVGTLLDVIILVCLALASRA